jgi:resuscitation-promoting factor RpfB
LHTNYVLSTRRIYDRFIKHAVSFRWLALVALLLSACTPAASTNQAGNNIIVTIQADGGQQTIEVIPGTSVQAALTQAGFVVNNLDKLDPPSYSALSEPTTIQVIRVAETFEIEEKVVPFSHQTVRNESLPEGQTLLIQPGVNGLQQITYRFLFEDGIEFSQTVFKTETLQEAQPEIVMVGVQTPFMTVAIPGTIAYLAAGNAWVMEASTGNRRPMVTTGDLDGRVFELSPDGNWLLFTRQPEIEGEDGEKQINVLQMVNTNETSPEPIRLGVENVVHYAGWVSNLPRTLAYSTVEPRPTAPGWQANNDLHRLSFNEDGRVVQDKLLVEPNSGGIYGWWGTVFSWSPDGKRVAYARPDSVGLVNTADGSLLPLLSIVPFQTRSDWAWVPGLGWSADHRVLYTVNHAPKSGLSSDETSPLFDLTALVPETELIIPMAPQSGMFAYPAPSPLYGGAREAVAYLQAVFPEQSESSRYRVIVMDRDGSNRMVVFPPEGSPGIEPQQVAWMPDRGDPTIQLALIYQGNLWLVYPDTLDSQQITGDGSINRMDWK